MNIFQKDKQAPAIGLIACDATADHPATLTPAPSTPERYYFNLTNGDAMIRDDDGIEASSIRAAVLSAMEAVEELRAQDPSNSDEWQGWRLEIVDTSGRAVQIIPLDALSAH